MILKGNQRANGRELALHLLNVEDNEHAVVHELRGFLSDDLIGAFKESEAISLGTKCQQYLFSLSLNPPKSAKVSVEEFERVIGEIERRMGLIGQPRAIVFHEKKGRRHAHCVWSRIDVNKMRAINLPHSKLRLQDISRELYLEHGWDMPAGLRKAKDRDPLNYSAAEAGQAKRVKRDPAELKKLLKSCWQVSDSRSAFANALAEHGFCLARGDRRGFVAVDSQGEVYSLSRWLGVKTKELSARLGDFAELPNVEDAVAFLNNDATEKNPNPGHLLKIKEHEEEVARLIAKQRQERLDLSDQQEAQRIAELKSRQEQLPTGLIATWARLTGQYQRICEQLADAANSCNRRDQRKQQGLIERHLAERRSLDRQLTFILAQHTFEQEFLDRSARVSTPQYRPDPNQPLILPREVAPFTATQLKRQPSLILAHLSDKKAQFSRNDILRGLAGFIPDPLQLRVAADKALASPELVRLPNGEAEEFTTKDFVGVEQALHSCARNLAQSGGFSVNSGHVDAAIRRQDKYLQQRVGAELSDEQIKSIRHILAPNQLCAVVGLAGAGKSTLLATAREAWERQGFRVHGAALAGKAADSLETASGIPSRTLASLETSWKNGYEPVDCGDVVVIDEAGMVGSLQLERVTDQLQKRGCKLVLVGDPDQLQPIQAGTPFRDIVGSVGASHLTEIRRQTSKWQRMASRDLADGHIETALQTYADHGAVKTASDRDQVIAKLVDDYMTDVELNGSLSSRLALSHRRIDVHAINQAIRAARNASGIGTEETLFQTDHGPRPFAAGDRILFTRNYATLGVRNGMLGGVEIVGDTKLTIRLDADGTGHCRKLTFKPREFPSFDHGFAVSIHRSQGCTVDKSFILSSRTMDENLTYVAMTRHKTGSEFLYRP
jgi:AAA domain/MobA/VirD2-like, nuclease domain